MGKKREVASRVSVLFFCPCPWDSSSPPLLIRSGSGQTRLGFYMMGVLELLQILHWIFITASNFNLGPVVHVRLPLLIMQVKITTGNGTFHYSHVCPLTASLLYFFNLRRIRVNATTTTTTEPWLPARRQQQCSGHWHSGAQPECHLSWERASESGGQVPHVLQL